MYLNISTPLLRAAVEAVVQKINPEMIFVLGSRKYQEEIYNACSRIILPDVYIGYQFLILLPAKDKRDEEELHKAVNKEFPFGASVTAIIIPIDVFNQWLQKGHLLAHHAYNSRHIVYNTGRNTLAKPGGYDMDAICYKVQAECTSWMETAIQLKEGAIFYKGIKQFKLGAFLLHQTAEQSLMAIIRVVTGYRAGTHNIERLLRYAHVFCGVPHDMFPDSSEQKKLLKLLQAAYIGGRYKNEFELTEQQFLLLETGIDRLLAGIKEAAVKFHTGHNKHLVKDSSSFFTALIH